MIVKSKTLNLDKKFKTLSGHIFPDINVSYQTYGSLNKNKNNAILICHYFSGDKHVAGKYNNSDEEFGWWNDLIGPEKAIDTDKYFVISSDALSCVVNSKYVKTTSPRDINPNTGHEYGMDFPVITIQDSVNLQKLLLDSLGIKKLYAVIGPSMGGLQALTWTALFPDFVKKCIPVAAGPKLDCFSSFFPLRLGIECIKNDPFFNNGQYYSKPESQRPFKGLCNAIYSLALIARGRNWGEDLLGGKNFNENPTYKIDNMFNFEKNIIEGVKKRASMYDPVSYIFNSKANLIFDLYTTFDNKKNYFKNLKNEFLIISEKNDIFLLPEDNKNFYLELLNNNIKAKYFEFDSPVGHLGSVTHSQLFYNEIKNFLNRGV